MTQLSDVLESSFKYFNNGIEKFTEVLISSDPLKKGVYAYDIKAALFDVSLALGIISSLGFLLGSTSIFVPITFIAAVFFIDEAMCKTIVAIDSVANISKTPDIPFFKPLAWFV